MKATGQSNKLLRLAFCVSLSLSLSRSLSRSLSLSLEQTHAGTLTFIFDIEIHPRRTHTNQSLLILHQNSREHKPMWQTHIRYLSRVHVCCACVRACVKQGSVSYPKVLLCVIFHWVTSYFLVPRRPPTGAHNTVQSCASGSAYLHFSYAVSNTIRFACFVTKGSHCAHTCRYWDSDMRFVFLVPSFSFEMWDDSVLTCYAFRPYLKKLSSMLCLYMGHPVRSKQTNYMVCHIQPR